MYDAGSLFKISFDGESPDEAHLSAIEQSGLGLRRAEGFGQVLFLSESLFGSIKAKQPVEYTAAPRRQNMAELRRKRLTWIMEQCERNSPAIFRTASLALSRPFARNTNTKPIFCKN